MPRVRPEDEFGDEWLHLLERGDRGGRPELVMWAAVLVRALSDVALWHAGRRYKGDERDASCLPSLVSIVVYRDALQWFKRREPGRIGFLEVCDMLNLDSGRVMSVVERMQARRQPLDMREFSIRRSAQGRGRMQLRWQGRKRVAQA